MVCYDTCMYTGGYKRVMPDRSSLLTHVKTHLKQLKRERPVGTPSRGSSSNSVTECVYDATEREQARCCMLLDEVRAHVHALLHYIAHTHEHGSERDKRQEVFACVLRQTQHVQQYMCEQGYDMDHAHEEERRR